MSWYAQRLSICVQTFHQSFLKLMSFMRNEWTKQENTTKSVIMHFRLQRFNKYPVTVSIMCKHRRILSLLRKAVHANYSWSCLETKLQRGFNFSVFFSFLFMAPEVVTHKFMDTIWLKRHDCGTSLILKHLYEE